MSDQAVLNTIHRKMAVVSTRPATATAVRKAAQSLSRRNVDSATCELMNEALCHLVDLCYEKDDGGFCNIDAATNRILIPVPWGRNGHQRWGLRPQESNILRAILFSRQDSDSLYFYEGERRSWFVNRGCYRVAVSAQEYLSRYPVTIAEYRKARAKVVRKK